MYRRYFIINLFTLFWGTYQLEESSSQQQCPQTRETTVRVNRGENADTGLALQAKDWPDIPDEFHVTKDGNWTVTICRHGGSCDSEIYPHIRVKVVNRTEYSIFYTLWQMTIIHTDYNDDGIYSLVGKYDRSSELFCTVALVTVTVDTLPVCNTFLISENEVVKFSCKWVPRSYGDKMQLMTKGQPPQLYEYEKRMRGTDTDSTWNTTTVISVMITTKDLFDGWIPDKCIVYNLENNFENQCTFSLFYASKCK